MRLGKSTPETNRKRPFQAVLLAALLVSVVAGITWAVRSLRPSAAAELAGSDDEGDAATGAPATAAPGQSTAARNGSTDKVTSAS